MQGWTALYWRAPLHCTALTCYRWCVERWHVTPPPPVRTYISPPPHIGQWHPANERTKIGNSASCCPIRLKFGKRWGFLPEITHTKVQLSSWNHWKIIYMCIYSWWFLNRYRLCFGQLLLPYNICLCSHTRLINQNIWKVSYPNATNKCIIDWLTYKKVILILKIW